MSVVTGQIADPLAAPDGFRLRLARLVGSLDQNAYVGTVGVFLGAGLVSLNGSLISVALPELRGALGLGFDEASWILTAYNMALMFIGPFSVFLGGLIGPRRVLLMTRHCAYRSIQLIGD